MVNYFVGLTTPETIKAHYRTLAMQHHPDKGGDTAVMQEVNAQYHNALKSIDKQKFGEHIYSYSEPIEQAVMDKLAELLKIAGLEIALIGTWLWIEGDTKPVKEQLKEMGCIWHKTRQMWYWRESAKKSWSKGKGNFGDMAWKYGYAKFKSEGDDKPLKITG